MTVVLPPIPVPSGDPTVFEELFKAPYASARHCQTPLAEQRNRYLVHCADLGMALSVRRTIAAYLLAVTKYLRLDERPDDLITSSEIETQADRWAKRQSSRARNARTRSTRKRFVTHATHWLNFLGRLQLKTVAPHPYADRVAAFAEYMRRERMLAPVTVTFNCKIVQQFLDRLCGSVKMEDITPEHVDSSLLDMIREGKYSRITVRTYGYALRAFLRFAQSQEWCRTGLADAIHLPRIFSQDTLPSAPSWDDVQRLLATTDGDSPCNIRDRAIILLLAVYGCRAGEVLRLRLEDIDWEREVIHFVRSKSSRTQIYPLTQPVGDAILRYLKEARPRSSSREIFLRLNAPFRPLRRHALTQVVTHRLRTLGLSLRHYGTHALRHACATHLLEQGLSLKEIGDHLGHRQPDTTRIYTKVDLTGLRQVADFEIGEIL